MIEDNLEPELVTEQTITIINSWLAQHQIIQNDVQKAMLFSHVKAMVERAKTLETLPEVDPGLFDELSEESLELARKTIINRRNIMTEIVIVIGDRMGKGQKIAEGINSVEGCRAIVIPGMAADMKLGDVMNKENADLGLSFCGSGGAGAITAQNKYGYSQRHGMRSIEEGETAINDGCKVLGFGFMDTEELGQRVAKAFLKKYPRS